MLVLSRNINQSILIGEQGEIEITILAIRGNQISIGIDAPKYIPIYREEIMKKYQLSVLPGNAVQSIRL